MSCVKNKNISMHRPAIAGIQAITQASLGTMLVLFKATIALGQWCIDVRFSKQVEHLNIQEGLCPLLHQPHLGTHHHQHLLVLEVFSDMCLCSL